MKHARWADPELAEDFTIHFLHDSEWTFCGLAFEGVQGGVKQGFITTNKKVTCSQCIERVLTAKKVKNSEMEIDQIKIKNSKQ